MGLTRVGVLLFGVGLCLSLLAAVAFGFVSGGTAVFCADHDPTYSVERVDGLSVQYSDGCNQKTVSSLVTGGGLLVVAGLAVGLGSILQGRSTDDSD